MWFHRFCSIAAALLGVSALSAHAQPQMPLTGEAPAAVADQPSGNSPLSAQQATQRSSLWQTVEAERRRAVDAVDNNPHRLSEAQRQELRDQIRRASLRDDGAVISPAVSRP
jgi:hypothetical protein